MKDMSILLGCVSAVIGALFLIACFLSSRNGKPQNDDEASGVLFIFTVGLLMLAFGVIFIFTVGLLMLAFGVIFIVMGVAGGI